MSTGLGTTLRSARRWYASSGSALWPIALLMALQVAYNLFIPQATRLIFDRAIAKHDLHTLGVIVVAMCGAFALRFVVSINQDRLVARASARGVRQMRHAMFEKLHALSHAYYARTPAGDVAARFSSDAAAIELLLVRYTPRFAYLTLNNVACALMLFAFEWRLATATIVGLAIAFMVPRRFAARAASEGILQKRHESESITMVQETIATHVIIKAFGLQQWSSKLFAQKLDEHAGAMTRASAAGSLVESATTLATSAVQILVVAYGAYLAIAGDLSVGALFGFVGLLAVMTNGIFGLSMVIPALISASPAVTRVSDLLEERAVIEDSSTAKPMHAPQREIRFESITFGYTPEREILSGVDVTFAIGQSTALVGSSGSGKSTILSLLMRYYPVSHGHIAIDDVDVAAVSIASLRSYIAVVPQDPILFNLTIRENIRLGHPMASDDEVEAAAKLAEIHDIVMAMPERYNTMVGERGGALSGGQRQRVAIARALVRDPKILLLDEATSALDPATEQSLNATLERVAQGRTVIGVTHRLASAEQADAIVVFDKGRVVERGSHSELLARDGVYANLWAKQMGFSIDASGTRASVSPDRLRAIPLFASLGADALARLAARCVALKVRSGELVFRAGDPGDLFYLIARGTLEFVTPNGDVGRTMEDGDYFGEIALLENCTRTGSIRARTPSLLLTLSRADFDALLADEPAVLASVRAIAESRRADDSLRP